MRVAWALALLAVLATSLSAQDAVVLRRHAGWIGGVAFSADGQLLASAGSDGKVRVADLADLDKQQVIAGHRDIVSAVAFAPQFNLLASGSFDHTVRLVNLAKDGATTMAKHRGAVMSVAFTADGKYLASGSADATVIVWHISGKPVQTLTNHKSWVNAVTFSKHGLLATGSSDNTVRIWGQKAGQWSEADRFEFPEGEVRSLAFSPDGKTLVAGVRYGTIKIIDLADKRVTTRKSHAADVWAVAFSPDGTTLASGDGDWDRPGEVRLWDTSTWKEKRLLKTSGEVLSLAYSPDGRYLAAGCWDKGVHLWRMDKQLER